MLEQMNRCRKTEWRKDDGPRLWLQECGLVDLHYQLMDAGPLAFEIERRHPECFSAARGRAQNLMEFNFDAAVELLKHPPARREQPKSAI